MNRPHLPAGVFMPQRPRLILPREVQIRPLTSRVSFWFWMCLPVWLLWLALCWLFAGYLYPGS